MTNARLVQVKYKGQVVDKAPMVCTPNPNNKSLAHRGKIYDVTELEYVGGAINHTFRYQSTERTIFSLEFIDCTFDEVGVDHTDSWLLIN